jgi:urease accessory protein UreF
VRCRTGFVHFTSHTKLRDFVSAQGVLENDFVVATGTGTARDFIRASHRQTALKRQRENRLARLANYLKGLNFARILTEEGQRKAIQHFQKSVQAGPAYAPAYAGLAECLIELAYFFGMDPKKAFAEAKAAALKAVALDDEFAEGHAALGLLRLLDDWDWAGADAETRRAIDG